MAADNTNFDKANRFIARMMRHAGEKQSLMQEFAVLSGSDIIENFRIGGQPTRWKPSHRAEYEGGQTLVDTSQLMKSAATPQVQGDTIILGSDLPYAAVHQYGIDKEVKTKNGSRRMRIDARPYLVFSNNFLKTAERIGSRWLLEGA